MIPLQRPVACLDIEATGVDPVKDRIIELAVVVVMPEGNRKAWSSRFNPDMPIPPEATAVHHITDEMVKDSPRFSDVAAKIHKGLDGKDLVGYNLRMFDLPILDEEFRRCQLKLDLATVRVVDCFGIFANKEPRDLSAAVRKFCGREHDGAHGAMADVMATLDVLDGQLSAYRDLSEMSLADLADFSKRDSDRQQADLAGKLYFKDGVLHYGFGKYRDKPISDAPDYASWMLTKDFPSSTCEYLRAELERLASIKEFPDYENHRQ